MTREQIIEILKTIPNWRRNKEGRIELTVDIVADAILALPLDLPSDEQITIPEYCENINEAREFIDGAKWMRDEIIKRNK